MRVGAKTHIGQMRAVNEDAYLVQDSILAVADGMGGHQAGEVASSVAVKTIAGWPFDPLEPEESLNQALTEANEKVFHLAQGDPNMVGMGTTLSVAWIASGQVYVAHIGDSRVYLFDHEGFQQVTQDHSVVGELLREGALTEAEALIHPHRNVLTRSLGTAPKVTFDIQKAPFQTGSGLLLCTDGLHSLVLAEEMEAIVRKHADPQIAAEELINLANGRGGYDNITVLIAII
ncbi:MAG: Stp1/IreP family PP2C-type Ser/Thr phosphatase [Firmicutes bacterium]|nr:Stp1/IreP family PP2C-type Ser/Thr phosphatase [Bacillota bacterium]